ncbi:MAG: AraC family transcriptional regulator [Lactovum sp.]
MKNEFEKVEHSHVNGLQFLINDIRYRQPHLHFDTEIIYVISGEGQVNTQQANFSLRQGQMMIFNSCQTHEFISKSSIRLLIMQIKIPTFASTYPALDSLLFNSQPFTLEHSDALFSHLLRAAKSYFDSSGKQELLTIGHSYLIFHELTNFIKFEQLNSSQQNKLFDLQKRIQRIATTIQENFVDGISLKQLAEQEGFSTTYFSHFFKNNFGISFQKYLDSLRCERGQHLLLSTSENLLNVTNLSGFSDIRTFNKAFEKRYGQSPKEFRNQKQKEWIINPEGKNIQDTKDEQRILNPKESFLILSELSNSLIL